MNDGTTTFHGAFSLKDHPYIKAAISAVLFSFDKHETKKVLLALPKVVHSY